MIPRSLRRYRCRRAPGYLSVPLPLALTSPPQPYGCDVMNGEGDPTPTREKEIPAMAIKLHCCWQLRCAVCGNRHADEDDSFLFPGAEYLIGDARRSGWLVRDDGLAVCERVDARHAGARAWLAAEGLDVGSSYCPSPETVSVGDFYAVVCDLCGADWEDWRGPRLFPSLDQAVAHMAGQQTEPVPGMLVWALWADGYALCDKDDQAHADAHAAGHQPARQTQDATGTAADAAPVPARLNVWDSVSASFPVDPERRARLTVSGAALAAALDAVLPFLPDGGEYTVTLHAVLADIGPAGLMLAATDRYSAGFATAEGTAAGSWRGLIQAPAAHALRLMLEPDRPGHRLTVHLDANCDRFTARAAAPAGGAEVSMSARAAADGAWPNVLPKVHALMAQATAAPGGQVRFMPAMLGRAAHLASDRQLQGYFSEDGRYLILFAAGAAGVIPVCRQVEQEPDSGEVLAAWTARIARALPAAAAA